jgi:hypothetical protein
MYAARSRISKTPAGVKPIAAAGLRQSYAEAVAGELGSACFIVLQMRGNQPLHHVALALANRRHVDRDGTGRRTLLRGMVRQMRDRRAPNLILAGQAVDIGTGAPRYTGAPQRQSVAPIAPDAKLGACHPLRCPGPECHTVRVGTCFSSLCYFSVILTLRQSSYARSCSSALAFASNPFQFLWRDALSGKGHSHYILLQQID